MTRSRALPGLLRAAVALVAVTLWTGLTRADVPPPNACHTAGEPCHTAGPGFASEGICTKTTCSKPFPEPTEWECTLCMEGEAKRPPSTGGCAGCTLMGADEHGGAWLALTLVGLWVARRRRAMP